MVDPVATPEDIRFEIDTDLDDPHLNHYLEAEVTELSTVNNWGAYPDAQRKRIEILGAVLRIASRRERARSSESTGPFSASFEEGLLENVRNERDRLADSIGIELPDDVEEISFRSY